MHVLRGLGCGVMQGYLFSGAKPAAEIDAWLQQVLLPRKAQWMALSKDDDGGVGDAPPVSVPGVLAG
jgi:hypothetical protein